MNTWTLRVLASTKQTFAGHSLLSESDLPGWTSGNLRGRAQAVRLSKEAQKALALRCMGVPGCRGQRLLIRGFE